MTKTFRELQVGELFVADNAKQIIFNRGDGLPIPDYREAVSKLVFQKRDEFGGHILQRAYGYGDVTPSVYYRIEPDNSVNTVGCLSPASYSY
jgi:hypothetical protein